MCLLLPGAPQAKWSLRRTPEVHAACIALYVVACSYIRLRRRHCAQRRVTEGSTPQALRTTPCPDVLLIGEGGLGFPSVTRSLEPKWRRDVAEQLLLACCCCRALLLLLLGLPFGLRRRHYAQRRSLHFGSPCLRFGLRRRHSAQRRSLYFGLLVCVLCLFSCLHCWCLSFPLRPMLQHRPYI